MPPSPSPETLRPPKGIQSTRNAVWSLTMTALASMRRAAYIARETSLVQMEVIAIHAAGRTLLSADADRRQVEELRLPEGVGLVQVVVHNPTAASRDYRLVLD